MMDAIALSEDFSCLDNLVGLYLRVKPKSVLWDVCPHEHRDNREVTIYVKKATEEFELSTRYLEQEESIKFQIIGNLIRENRHISVKFWVLNNTQFFLNES